MEPLSQVMDALSLLYTQLALKPFLTRFAFRWFCCRYDAAADVFPRCSEQDVLSTLQVPSARCTNPAIYATICWGETWAVSHPALQLAVGN